MHPSKRRLLENRNPRKKEIGAAGNFFVMLGLWSTTLLMVSSFWSVFDPVDKDNVIQIVTSDFGVFIFSAPIVITGYLISNGTVRASGPGMNAAMVLGFFLATGFGYKIGLLPNTVSKVLAFVPPSVKDWIGAGLTVILIVWYFRKGKSLDAWMEKNFGR